MFRRFLLCAMALFLLVAPLGVTAQTAEINEQAAQALIDAHTYGITVDISQTGLKRSSLEALFDQLYDSGQLPWYAGERYTYHYDTDTYNVVDFTPDLMDSETYNRALYEQKAAEFLQAYVKDYMDPVQTALAIHDGLIVNCIYDETLAKNTGYDLLVNGSTVCLGYAQAYQDLLSRVGIPSIIVTSEPMEHAWNLVELDGQWYHVDVTWDDPTPDSYGYVNHEYFLLTDEEIAAGDEPHYDWETDITCTDTRFADGFWRDTTSQICFDDNQTAYYLYTEDWDNYIYAYDLADGTEELIYTESEDYINIGSGRYCYSHGSLSYWNDRLYYNKMDALISMDTDGEDRETEYRYDAAGNGQYLSHCYVHNNRLYATTADHDGNQSSFTESLSAAGYHVHSYTAQDMAPNCTDPGYTLYTCECGLTAKADYLAPTGHDYEKVSSQIATFWSDGWNEESCRICGDTLTTTLYQLDFAEWVTDNPGICSAVVIGLIYLCLNFRKKKVKA